MGLNDLAHPRAKHLGFLRSFVTLVLLVTTAVPTGVSVDAATSPVGYLAPADLETTVPPASSTLVHTVPGRWRDALASARSLGLHVGTRYPMIDVFIVGGPRASLAGLAENEAVRYLEANSSLEYFTNTSHEATRGGKVLERVVRVNGRRIDGRGVGVAIVDTGIDGTHPDLVERMGGNVRIVCTRPGFLIGTVSECGGPKQAVELEDTDSPALGGHGTHVAGIVAGTGVASDGRYHGAAPGATLYGVGIGTVLLIENALDGLRWVLDNHDRVTPPIRVVNNSWGSGYDPEDANDPATAAITKMIDLLVEDGVTVVFSAGNSGGDGSSTQTSLECANPTPGVICVANYDDVDLGGREGSLSPQSSRGRLGDPSTWPDISAPGSTITSTCRRTLPVCNFFGGGSSPEEFYATLSGTSMAAPHVAGIAAQLLQVAPSLSPRRIEDLLEDTAHMFTSGAPYERDPSNPSHRSSFDKGHGLVDVLAAIRLLLEGSP